MPELIDFLKPETSQIRHQITNIVESYNHDWDLIAELAQNSIDAITLGNPEIGEIYVSIDAARKEIVFRDNGCGISPKELPSLLAPFSSAKLGQQELIGQKGVGISFVIFVSKLFEIESHHADGASRAKISGANSWLEEETNQLPKLQFEKISDSNLESRFGTKITLRLPKHSENSFWHYSFSQLAMVLLTRTALGDVETIWGRDPNKRVKLNLLNLNGERKSEELECSYYLPTRNMNTKATISLSEFKSWIRSGDRTDLQKRQKLKNKVIFSTGEINHSGRKIRYWACIVPKRVYWDQLSVTYQLVNEQILELSPQAKADQYGEADYLFSGGMYTSTRGMPTGIRSEMITKGWAGYLPNFFILLDDPGLRFDIGRKSIPSRQLGSLRKIAADVFLNFMKVAAKYMGGDHNHQTDPWNRTAIFNEIRTLPDLNSKVSKFLKRPSNQEATIAAMFYELLGAGRLDGFKPYISGYKNKYDLYAIFNNRDVVIEFKSTLDALLRDFDDETKMFDEIDLVVIWDVAENDYQTIGDKGLTLDEVEIEMLGESESSIIDYWIGLGPTKPIGVICLKRLIYSY